MKTVDFTVSRTIHGSADEVFDVWLDPKSPGGLWFGVERAIINPIVEGVFYHLVNHQGRSWPHYGRFIRLDRGRAIEHTWVSEATRGLETVVTITLTSRDGGTEISFITPTCQTMRWGAGTTTESCNISATDAPVGQTPN